MNGHIHYLLSMHQDFILTASKQVVLESLRNSKCTTLTSKSGRVEAYLKSKVKAPAQG